MNFKPIPQFRIVIVGDSTVGKSALVASFAKGKFYGNTEPTICVDFFSKLVELENGVKARLQLWDTAGQERYRSLTQYYYRNSCGVLLAYDVGNRSSFDHLLDWMKEAIKYTENAAVQLVACKCDLDQGHREISSEEGQIFADNHGMLFTETSAKNFYHINEAFELITRTLLEKLKRREIAADYVTKPLQPLCELSNKNTKCRICVF